MTDPKHNSYRLLWMLGAAMTLPAILVSGPVAGYILGHYVLVKYLKWPGFWVPLLVLVGFWASGLHAYRLIKKIKDFDSKNI